MIVGIWGIGNAMLINLASLQGVPTELYDAAKIDGAGYWRSFWNVTFPMISPVIFYNLFLTVVGLFQYFLVPLVVNQGTGRRAARRCSTTSTCTRPSSLPEHGLRRYAGVVPVSADFVTMILFWSQRFWVFYAGERK